MIQEGMWFEHGGWKIWIYGGHKMTYAEKLHEAKEIIKSGYLKVDSKLSLLVNSKIKNN